MKSKTVPSFWNAYSSLDEIVRTRAKKAFKTWIDNPFHPSLNFKCINRKEKIWSVRITRGYRAVGIFEDDTITWFWIGNHDDYENHFL